MKRFLLIGAAALAAAAALAGGAAAGGAGGVTGPAIYVNGQLYRTVGTPTDFSGTGAPASSYDTIYQFPDGSGNTLQPSVATAAPGDPGFNGGRWMVHDVSFPEGYGAAVAAVDTNGSGNIDSAAELDAAFTAGLASDDGVVKSFECPVIPLPHGHR